MGFKQQLPKPSRARSIYDDMMYQTYEYAVDTYTVIKDKHFWDMRRYLLSCIYVARKSITF